MFESQKYSFCIRVIVVVMKEIWMINTINIVLMKMLVDKAKIIWKDRAVSE